MIVVTGATGQLGRHIVHELLQRLPGHEIGASVRDPDKAAELAARGVRVRRGDFDDAASLAHAFEGAEQVLIVSSNASARGGDPVAQHRTAIAAARNAGVQRIVYTSHMAARAGSLFAPMQDHVATEALLAESGMAWTALRNGFYAESAVMFMGDGLETGVLEMPEDGKIAWTTHADLAAAAAHVLLHPGLYEGATPPLTALDALDFADLAAIASSVLERPIERKVLGDDALRTRMMARGLPPKVVDITLGLYRAAQAGEFAATDTTLETLLGRPPASMREVIAAQAGRGR